MARRTPHPAEDLFGEVPVTWPEVWDWIEQVAGIPRDSWRARWYCRCWDVPDKIRAAKRRGCWPLDAALGQEDRGECRERGRDLGGAERLDFTHAEDRAQHRQARPRGRLAQSA